MLSVERDLLARNGKYILDAYTFSISGDAETHPSGAVQIGLDAIPAAHFVEQPPDGGQRAVLAGSGKNDKEFVIVVAQGGVSREVLSAATSSTTRGKIEGRLTRAVKRD